MMGKDEAAPQLMTVRQLAQQGDVTVHVVRNYLRRGLLQAARHTESGYQLFSASELQRMRFIRTAQQLGFTLAEIGDRLPGIWDAPDPAPAIAGVLAVKLQEIDARIAALQALRETLAERVAAACPLLAAPEKI